MRTFTVEERRARLAVRHHLTASTKQTDLAAVARSFVGLHATDPATAFLSAAARMKRPTVDGIEAAIYDEHAAARLLAMRRTMFIVPTDLIPMVHAAASQAVAANERKRLVSWIDEAGFTKDASRWLHKVSAAAVAELELRSGATTAEIVKAVPDLQRRIVLGPRTNWQTEQNVGPRVLLVLAAEGAIARSRPLGSWISTQHRWAPMSAWLPDGIPHVPVAEARADLVTRWLRTFGPAPVSDLKWWTGWTLGATRAALAAAGATEVDLDGAAGVAMPDDLERMKPSPPWVALLPALDTTVMGWQARGWFLGEHAPRLFDRSGNAGPTVWWNGQVVGGWAQRADGDLVWRVFDDVGRDANRAIERRAAELATWLGDRRFIPRFRTPLERELNN
jgi:hypothetical protein